MRVALIPSGPTEWHTAGRFLGRVELALSADAQQQCATWAQQLTGLPIERIYHAPDELASQTAKAVARRLSVPTKSLDDLSEVDMGLWAGLTESQLKSRYPTAHRELCDAPLNVSPPGGENLGVAATRLNACIRKQFRKKNGDSVVAVVVRPFSFALAQCVLAGHPLAKLLEEARGADAPSVIEVQESTAVAPAE